MPAKVLLCPVLDRSLAARQGTWNSEKWGCEIGMSRRSILMGASALPWLAGSLGAPHICPDRASGARRNPADPARAWQWRPRCALDHHAVADGGERRAARKNVGDQFTDPLARNDDAVAQAGRSSTEDQRRELSEAIAALKRKTGASRVALVANSRGGYAIRNVVKYWQWRDVSMPCCAAFPITACLPGMKIPTMNLTAAGRSCAA